jgi:3-oxoacyl-[acyl-carrier protein] reductase
MNAGEERRRHVMITGAGGGLGRALARAFWRAGCDLSLIGKNGEALDRLKADLGSGPGKVLPVTADLRLRDAPKAIMSAVSREFTTLDVLINNAGIHGPVGRLETLDQQSWDEALQVDLLAPAALCRLAIPSLGKSGRGRIINISGGGAGGPRPNFTAYAAAKAGLVRFSETLAAELADTPITVNCLAPGTMKTKLLAEIALLSREAVGQKELAEAEKALERTDDSMAAAVELCLFLASPASDGITGRLISAVWDDYQDWPKHLGELKNSDLYTLRRITGRDRGKNWGDK